MRRANGQGSIYRIKGRNVRKPYVVRVCTGERTAKGDYKRADIDSFATLREAEAFLAKYSNHPIDWYNYTLEELYNEWYARREKKFQQGKIKRQALDCNRAAWVHLKPLAKKKVRVLTTDQLQSQLDLIAENPDSRGKLPSKSALEKVKSLLSMLFDFAVDHDIVDRNYAKSLDIPDAPEGDRLPWSDLERAKIEKAAEEGVEWADCIVMLYYSGLRIEEFVTLKKFGAQFSEDGRLMALVGGNKSAAGRDRLIPIHPKTEKYWSKWYNYDPSSEYVIPKSASPLSRKRGADHFNKDWWRENCYYAAIDKINAGGGGIRRLSPHSCRHTFATLAMAADIPSEKIAMLMGHSDFKHTKRYTHEDVTDLRACVARIIG